jgi:hypothetical protein
MARVLDMEIPFRGWTTREPTGKIILENVMVLAHDLTRMRRAYGDATVVDLH